MKNLRTTKIAGLFLSIGFACLLSSCDKNDGLVSPESEPIEVATIDGANYDPMLEEVAKAVAGSMNDVSMRTFIKGEVLKKFDGDYDILYRNADDKMVNGRTVKSIFETSTRNSASRTAPLDLDRVLVKYPLLNISVPVNAEKWDVNSYEPLVVVISNIKDESKLDKIKAYDKEGNIHWLDAQKAPNVPVIVIGSNERTVLQPNGEAILRKDFVKTTVKNGRISLYEDPNGGGGGGGCTYADNSWLYLKGMSSPDISHYESWAKGAPEITMQVFTPGSADNFTTLGKIRQIDEMEPGSRSDINDNNWWNVNYSVVYWNPSTIAKTLLFHFYEVDGGIPNVEISLGGGFKIGVPGTGEYSTSLGVKVTIQDGDDEIGQMLVDKCGPAPQPNNVYDVGAFFNFRLGN